MKTYRVPVVYQMYGYVEVSANSIDEAVKKVEVSDDIPLPADADYVDGSFEIDYEGVDFSAN